MTKHSIKLAALFLMAAGVLSTSQSANAQTAILAEMYGRGVHAYYAGQHDSAHQLLSSAINGGIKDPRAYYFRGIVASQQGRNYEAEADWQQGAALEARTGINPSVGRSLSRFQGSQRLKLEQIRQSARLQAMTTAIQRSNARTDQLQAAQPPVRTPRAPIAIPGGSLVAPPPAPAAADDDPFKDDTTSMAGGTAQIEADDALKGADVNPFSEGGGMGGGDAAGAGAGGDDPFGGDAGGAEDPFGGGGDAGGADDPFGGGGADMDDPFAN